MRGLQGGGEEERRKKESRIPELSDERMREFRLGRVGFRSALHLLVGTGRQMRIPGKETLYLHDRLILQTWNESVGLFWCHSIELHAREAKLRMEAKKHTGVTGKKWDYH